MNLFWIIMILALYGTISAVWMPIIRKPLWAKQKNKYPSAKNGSAKIVL